MTLREPHDLLPFEPTDVCANCSAGVSLGDALYDDQTGRYHCSQMCFHEWADDNIVYVTQYYMDHNLSEGG